jgi:pilus assembly protein CpaF
MLQAMNTGHDGSMTTVHANTPKDALGRLEVMIAMSGYDIPIRALRTQIASAVQLVVQATRLTGGKRKVTRVSEITGIDGESVILQDLFAFEQSDVDAAGNAMGRFYCYGVKPKCAERIENRGQKLAEGMFEKGVMEESAK